MPPPDSITPFATISDALCDSGYCILKNALSQELISTLRRAGEQRSDTMRPARVGRGDSRRFDRQIRTDQITWIEEGDAQTEKWLTWTDTLQQYLNRHLFLGLQRFESHFAQYDEGDFYRRHVDAFAGQSNRKVSLVLYLNRDWRAQDAGELVLYGQDSEQPLARVRPEENTLVAFLSDRFPHEVRPAQRPRLSIAGWYRLDARGTGSPT